MPDVFFSYASRELTLVGNHGTNRGVARLARKKFAPLNFILIVLGFCSSLAGCAAVDDTPTPSAQAEPAPAAPAPTQPTPSAIPPAQNIVPAAIVPPPLAPFDESVTAVARTLFSQASARLATSQATQQPWVIDPLIDGLSAMQSSATQAIEDRIADIARLEYPRFALQSLSPASLDNSPLILLGTFTPVNHSGETTGKREAYRLCLVLADLKTAGIVAKATARSHRTEVDHSPTRFFSDSPVWMKESATEAYIKTCQETKVGDRIPANYLDGIASIALTRQGITAYDNGRYPEALDRFTEALKLPASNQFQIYTGLHLANLKLGRKTAANEFFGKLVDHGFAQKRLAVKFLFKPGATSFWPDRRVSGSYSVWLKTIAKRTVNSNSCLEITGHSSPTGAEPLNERLSQQRAEYIEQKLEAEAPQLRGRTIASGAGSRENLVASGKDDLTDALDRRVVFQVHSCS